MEVLPMARPPDPGKQRYWLDLMGRWQQSQLTVRAFCERLGIREANFYLWRRVLRRRGLVAQLAPPHQPPAPSHAAFVKLTLDAAPVATTAIELVLENRRLLRIHPGFDPATLRQLLRLLEEPAC
jgi:transposase